MKPLTPPGRGVDKGQPLVPGSQSLASHAGHGRGAENRIGALGMKGGEGRWRWMVPIGESPWSGPWLEHRMAFWREVRHGLLGESPSHYSSTVGLDEQRQSMVLELYCRKAGRKREGRKERETERKG